MTSVDLIAVFLGDASPHEPYARLQAALSGGPTGATSIGPVERWVSLLCAPGDAVGLAATLSTQWPCVHVAAADEGAAFSLYRDGACLDTVAPQRGQHGGPEHWLKLVGSPRNAMRLEVIWGAGSLPAELLDKTAAIIGWDLSLARTAAQALEAKGELPEGFSRR